MRTQSLLIALLSVFLAFGCTEENKTTNTAASHNTSENPPAQTPSDNPQTPSENPQTPSENPQTPSENPQTPSDNPQTPSENPQTPSENPQTPSENPQTPSDNPQTPSDNPQTPSDNPQTPEQQEVSILQAKIDDTIVQIQWEDNDAVNALKEMAKTSVVTVKMSQYGGFEQVGSLGKSLPRNDSQTTTSPGDIVLYSGDQIVVFYGSNSWSYTRLGKITDKTEAELKAMLDKDNVTLYLSFGTESAETPPASSENKALVAYFSVTKNTKAIAEYISEHTNSVLYEIVPEKPYNDADINYGDDSSRTSIEQNDPKARPAIASTIEDIDQYDVIYLGYPIWWGQAPKIMYTFLESVTIKENVTIVPFVTSGSSPIGSSATNLKQSAPSANWLEGRRFAGGTDKSTVTQWIDSLNLN